MGREAGCAVASDDGPRAPPPSAVPFRLLQIELPNQSWMSVYLAALTFTRVVARVFFSICLGPPPGAACDVKKMSKIHSHTQKDTVARNRQTITEIWTE
jgi:hypothetical protein